MSITGQWVSCSTSSLQRLQANRATTVWNVTSPQGRSKLLTGPWWVQDTAPQNAAPHVDHWQNSRGKVTLTSPTPHFAPAISHVKGTDPVPGGRGTSLSPQTRKLGPRRLYKQYLPIYYQEPKPLCLINPSQIYCCPKDIKAPCSSHLFGSSFSCEGYHKKQVTIQ